MNKEYIVCTPICEKKLPFYISLAGISYEDPLYKIKRNNDDVFVAEYIISGQGTVCVDKKVYSVSKGDMYIIPSYSDHTYYSDPKNPWRKIWFNASGDLCNELMEIYGIAGKIVFKNADGYNYMKKMLSVIENKNYTLKELIKETTLIFSELILFLSEFKDEGENTNTDAYIIKQYIDMNVEKNISVKELSSLIFRSESQTIRIFKKAYQKTPYDYLLSQKISRAKTLLKSTSLTVKEISFHLGFCDEHYFSDVFKNKTTFTPKQYKMKNK